MFESGGRARFPFEAAQGARVAGHVLRQKFEGHRPAETNILGPVHQSHASAIKTLHDTVMVDGPALQRKCEFVQLRIDGRLHIPVRGSIGRKKRFHLVP